MIVEELTSLKAPKVLAIFIAEVAREKNADHAPFCDGVGYGALQVNTIEPTAFKEATIILYDEGAPRTY